MSQPYAAAAFAARSSPRLFCIGRNYARHIAELDHGPDAAECVVFIKPASALVAPGEVIPLPTDQGAIHHEAELVAEIATGGMHIDTGTAREHIGAIGLGLDLTLRDVQTRLKNTGEPWERSKTFDYSAPLGPLQPLTRAMDLTDLSFTLSVDDQDRQHGHSADMLVGIEALVAMLSRHWRLLPGDLIFTGTPEGVGPLEPGMRLSLSSPLLPSAEWITA